MYILYSILYSTCVCARTRAYEWELKFKCIIMPILVLPKRYLGLVSSSDDIWQYGRWKWLNEKKFITFLKLKFVFSGPSRDLAPHPSTWQREHPHHDLRKGVSPCVHWFGYKLCKSQSPRIFQKASPTRMKVFQTAPPFFPSPQSINPTKIKQKVMTVVRKTSRRWRPSPPLRSKRTSFAAKYRRPKPRIDLNLRSWSSLITTHHHLSLGSLFSKLAQLSARSLALKWKA